MTKIISKTIFATMKICCWNREQRMTMNSDNFLFDRENDSCSLQVQLKNGKRHVEIKELKKNKRNLEYLITVQHLLNVHNGKLDFIWLVKKDKLML